MPRVGPRSTPPRGSSSTTSGCARCRSYRRLKRSARASNSPRRPGPRRPPRPSTRSRPPPSPLRSPPPPEPAPPATEKLQKVLARSGLGSRRDMEAWIAAGRVLVNDAAAALGQRVAPSDRVKVDGRLLAPRWETRLPRVLVYHKPAGEIVSADDPAGRPTVFDRLPRVRGGRWIAVGRLDFNTSGLLVLTTSGDLAARLMHPRYGVEREYAIRIDGRLSAEEAARLTAGVLLEDGPARLESLADQGGEGRNRWYRACLREGRNREVRRLFEAVGRRVTRLMRVRFGPIVLPPGLRRGQFRALDDAEVSRVLAALGMDSRPTAAPRSTRRRGSSGPRVTARRVPPR
ncbi:MAG: pseudouridine synthase [Burkholderiales bacterium]